MRCWELPAGVELEPVIRWCRENKGVDRLIISTRLDQDGSGQKLLCPAVAQSIDSLFGPRILDRRCSSCWPGTELSGHNALVITIDFDCDLIEPMSKAGKLLSNWTQWNLPPLPEDLCLYQSGEELPTLVSVTHESEAWIISANLEEIKGVDKMRLSGLSPNELLIPGHKKGFVG